MQKIENIFIDRQIEHIRKVQDYMIFLEKNRDRLPFEVEPFELLRRAMQHDLNKFSPELIHNYIKIAEYYENKKLGLSNDHVNEGKLYRCCDKHSFSETHHIKYHIENNSQPSNIDICEMCCDWTACSDREGKDNTKYFKEVLIKECAFCKKEEDNFLKILEMLKK